jgi:hypothetical protein
MVSPKKEFGVDTQRSFSRARFIKADTRFIEEKVKVHPQGRLGVGKLTKQSNVPGHQS